MSQIENGVRALLAYPPVYDTFQWLIGGKSDRQDFVEDYIKPSKNDHVLDIGCGTADMLNYLPEGIRYFGFDQSKAYINHARSRFGDRGTFKSALVDSMELESLPGMNIVLATGLIHHLEDHQVVSLLETAQAALVHGGRFVALDPCYESGQNPVAKWLIDRDRGNNVRNQEAYLALAKSVFGQVESHVIHRAWLPYTHHIMVCQS